MAAPQCPICIETLQAQIRMLTCGDNLEDMPSPSSQIRWNNLRLVPLTNIVLKTYCLKGIF